jgi:predicted Zn-dependent protease
MNCITSAKWLLVLGCIAPLACAPAWLAAQHAGANTSASVQHGIDLVASGHCKEALPLLKRGLPRIMEKTLRYHAQMATVRCAMAVDEEQTASDTLLALSSEEPDNPEVLYIETHFFSELGMRAARRLQSRAPDSYQAKRLQAESLESQGKDEQAAEIYRDILKTNPNVPGIHYRLGQIALAQAGPSGSTDAAKAEFEKETEVDPSNASAAFVLGELDRRGGDFNDAIRYFTRATKLDAGFSEAFLALGMSFTASGKFAEAKAPLKHYVTLQPDDPAGHYQLAIAYARTGDKQSAQSEMALQKQAAALKKTTDNAQGHSVQP